MAYRVTKAVTKYGTVYSVGDVIEHPSSTERSLARLFGWSQIDVAPVADQEPDLMSLRKPELVQLAESRGLDASGLTKAQLVDLLSG